MIQSQIHRGIPLPNREPITKAMEFQLWWPVEIRKNWTWKFWTSFKRII